MNGPRWLHAKNDPVQCDTCGWSKPQPGSGCVECDPHNHAWFLEGPNGKFRISPQTDGRWSVDQICTGPGLTGAFYLEDLPTRAEALTCARLYAGLPESEKIIDTPDRLPMPDRRAAIAHTKAKA